MNIRPICRDVQPYSVAVDCGRGGRSRVLEGDDGAIASLMATLENFSHQQRRGNAEDG